MAASFLITIPKGDLKLKSIHDFSSGIFIDNSGSTSSHLPTVNTTVLQAELSICQLNSFNHVVLWDTSASICTDLSAVRPQGGTEPTAIFTNPITKSAFDASDIVVFVTDGEISPSSVTQLAIHTENRLTKALVICVIVHNKSRSPSQINVSVVAPLMMATNVLCLFYDGQTFYNLASKGQISQFYPASNQLDQYENLSTVDLKELFEQIHLYEYQKLPDGYIAVRENEKEIIAMDFNQFLQIKDLESISILTEDDWKTLIQYGKIGNKLTEIRTLVSQMKNESIRQEKEKSRQTFDFTNSKQRDDLIARIVKLKMISDVDHSNELIDLRLQLSRVSDRANIEELNYLKYVNANLHQSRQHWNNIEHLLHEQEKGSYSINDFNFSSNRANRAKVLTDKDDDDDDDSQSNDILDHSGVPRIECSICMEDGPFVLWLNAPTDLEQSTNDFIINFPLQGNEQLLSCFVTNPVCGTCAKSYITATMNTGLITLYRQPCSGFIPLNWSIESNRRVAYRSLCRILSGNRLLHHVPMLLLALLDDFQSKWFDEKIKRYLMEEIMKNIWTTETFSEEGTKMVFTDALNGIVVQQSQALLRQPVKAVCRILKFYSMFHPVDEDLFTMLLRKRFAVLCLEKQCSISKHSSQHLISIQEQVTDIIFDTLCGIPIEHSFKPVDLHNEKFKSFLGPYHSDLVNALNSLTETISLDLSRTFSPVFISYVLYLLTRIPLHDRPMKLFIEFALKHRPLRDQLDLNWNEINAEVNGKLFGQYHPISEMISPSYSINLGRYSCPSKLFFAREPLWRKEIEYTRISLQTFVDQIKETLDERLKNTYGSVNPNQHSGHVSIHLIVAEIVENQYPQVDQMNEEMIRDCLLRLSRTRGHAGNMYSNTIFLEIVLLIDDYLKFRRQTKNMSVDQHDMITRSYRHKVFSELSSAGVIFDSMEENFLFEPSKFSPPRLLRPEETSFDFQSLKQRVQQSYLSMKTTPNEQQTCMNIEIKDFIEFAFKLEADELLPIWAEEQTKIISSIITTEDQIDQPLKYIAGLDISFVKTNDQAVASMVIFEYPSLNIVAKISVNCRMKIPYIPGYLAFREAPVFMKLIDIQKEHCSHLTPQLILMDGNGVWHPRRAGIASHFGVLSGIPCFGVSKNVLLADGIGREQIEQLLTEKAPGENEYFEVIGDSGDILGLAYNVTGFIKNAVYISVGHKITLPTALKIFESVTKYRNCEPIRQADLLSREKVSKLT